MWMQSREYIVRCIWGWIFIDFDVLCTSKIFDHLNGSCTRYSWDFDPGAVNRWLTWIISIALSFPIELCPDMLSIQESLVEFPSLLSYFPTFEVRIACNHGEEGGPPRDGEVIWVSIRGAHRPTFRSMLAHNELKIAISKLNTIQPNSSRINIGHITQNGSLLAAINILNAKKGEVFLFNTLLYKKVENFCWFCIHG